MAFLDSSNHVCIEHYSFIRVWVLSSANALIVFVNFQAREPTAVIALCGTRARMECALSGWF